MTEVSNLTEEIISQYQNITNRPLGIEEYLRIRKQAVEELNVGYYPRGQTRTVSEPVKTEVKKKVISTGENKASNTVVNVNTYETFTDKEEEDPFFALCDSVD